MMNPSLDAVENPLSDHPVLDPDILGGFHLLEADAGTGKTWTVARLVLRAVVEKNIPIGRIAVLTFTIAAAAELRQRIGELFEQWLNNGTDPQDPFARYWQSGVDPETMRARLRLARLQLDDAPIGTIHAFCQRIINDNALSLGRWDRPTVGPSDGQPLREAVAAWWRNNIVNGKPDIAVVCGPGGLTKGKLETLLTAAIADPGASIHCVDITGPWQDLPTRLQSAVEALRLSWRDEQDGFMQWLHDGCGLHLNKYRVETAAAAAGTLADYLDGYPATITRSPDALLFLDRRTIEDAYKASTAANTADLFRSFSLASELVDLLRQRAGLAAIVASEIRDHIRSEVKQIQQRAGILGFDDLLEQTRAALVEPNAGPALAAVLRARFSLAFVDEFQDTDPAQWTIFDTIYRPADSELIDGAAQGCGLVLVGDPKQAIYSFRNADVFTYLAAGAQGARLHRLNQNHRSNQLLIDAVNDVFSRPNAFALPQIVFEPTRAGRAADSDSAQPPADERGALAFIALDDQVGTASPHNVPELERRAIRGCSHEILRLLEQEKIPPAEIAVLVPSRLRGSKVRKALAELGVAAAEISQDSVFASTEASDLFRLIGAVAAPSRSDLVRGALTTQLVGFNLEALESTARDSARWQAVLSALDKAALRWQAFGPQAALRDLLFTELKLAESVTKQAGGERRLTNLLHLLSLLAAEPSVQREAAQAQVWLGRQIHESADGFKSDQSLVRLESDDRLVSIMTIHASKGLEFPFVFLPFSWAGGGSRAADVHRIHDSQTGERIIADPARIPFYKPSNDRQARPFKEASELEHFQESVRLNYVAVTRAERRCYLFWGQVASSPGFPASAWLLDSQTGWPAPKPNAQRIVDRQIALAAARPGIVVTDWAELAAYQAVGGQHAHSETVNVSDLVLHQATRRIVPAWLSRSFSSMTGGLDSAAVTLRPDHDEAQTDQLIGAPVESRSPDDPIPVAFSFPRGANAGSCLHDILERSDFTRPVSVEQAAFSLRRYGLQADPTEVAGWMDRVLASALPGRQADDSFRLSSVASRDSIRELSYTLAVEQLSPLALTRAIATSYPVPLLDTPNWDGFLNGFIDLLVRVDGQYWLLDWKSNWLGEHSSDYRPARLDEPMVDHAYTLQMTLYTVAVHRMLRARLPDYDYDTHFGGVRYLFLRGMDGDDSYNGVYSARPAKALVMQLDELLGAGHV